MFTRERRRARQPPESIRSTLQTKGTASSRRASKQPCSSLDTTLRCRSDGRECKQRVKRNYRPSLHTRKRLNLRRTVPRTQWNIRWGGVLPTTAHRCPSTQCRRRQRATPSTTEGYSANGGGSDSTSPPPKGGRRTLECKRKSKPSQSKCAS